MLETSRKSEDQKQLDRLRIRQRAAVCPNPQPGRSGGRASLGGGGDEAGIACGLVAEGRGREGWSKKTRPVTFSTA